MVPSSLYFKLKNKQCLKDLLTLLLFLFLSLHVLPPESPISQIEKPIIQQYYESPSWSAHQWIFCCLYIGLAAWGAIGMIMVLKNGSSPRELLSYRFLSFVFGFCSAIGFPSFPFLSFPFLPFLSLLFSFPS